MMLFTVLVNFIILLSVNVCSGEYASSTKASTKLRHMVCTSHPRTYTLIPHLNLHMMWCAICSTVAKFSSTPICVPPRWLTIIFAPNF